MIDYVACDRCGVVDYCVLDNDCGHLCIRCIPHLQKILSTAEWVRKIMSGQLKRINGRAVKSTLRNGKLVRRTPAAIMKRLREEKADLANARKRAYETQIDMVTGLPGEVCRECGTTKCVHNVPRPVSANDQTEIPF